MLGSGVQVNAEGFSDSTGTLTVNGDLHSQANYLSSAGTGSGEFDLFQLNGNAFFNGAVSSQLCRRLSRPRWRHLAVRVPLLHWLEQHRLTVTTRRRPELRIRLTDTMPTWAKQR
jgi:hypothetical protein